MKVLLDADILRFETAFGAETGWKAITKKDELPPFSYVEKVLLDKIDNIMRQCEANECELFITSGRTFRYDIAKRKPYKSGRKLSKPFHFHNLTAYMTGVMNATVVTHIEADDAIAIAATENPDTTVVASRDKDLRQIKGNFFCWELGRQPSFAEKITKEGWIALSEDHKKLSGTGYSWFLAQVLLGDSVDTTPGLPGCGPVKAFELLSTFPPEQQLENVINAYKEFYGDTWEAELIEQGQLHWLVRRLDGNRQPEMWNFTLTD